ncbi:MAG: GAF domain-containing protein [Candidatus Edwardsbacteria bacterium]
MKVSGKRRVRFSEKTFESIVSSLEPEKVLQIIVEKICQTLGADASAILLLEPKSQDLLAKASYKLSRWFIRLLRIPWGSGTAGKVVAEKKPLTIKDLKEFFTREKDKETLKAIKREELVSEILVPILLEGKSLGSLNVYYRKKHHFTKRDLRIATEFAHFSARAIQNALVFEKERKRSQQMALINEISRKAAFTLELDKLLQTTCELIQKRFHYYDVALLLLDEKNEELVVRAHSGGYQGLTPLGYRQKISTGIIGWVAKEGKSLLANDVLKEPQYLIGNFPSTKSELCVPIKIGWKVLGVIDVQSRRLNTFDENDRQVLEILAGELAITIENARLYSETAERMKESTVLCEVGKSLTTILEPEMLLEEILETIQRTFGYLNCAVLLIDKEKDELYIKCARGYPEEEVKDLRLKMGQGITGWVAQTGELLNVSDVRKDSRYIVGAKDALSELAVPLKFGAEVVGVLDIESNKLNAFSEREERFLSSLASQAAVALENARLFQEAQQKISELSFLHKVGQTIGSSLDLEKILSLSLDLILKIIPADTSSLMLLDEINQELKIKAARGLSEETISQISFKIGEGLAGWVAKTGTSLLLADGMTDSRFKRISQKEEMHSSICVPLRVKDKIFGVLNLNNMQRTAMFTQEHLQLALTLANSIAIAIENASLVSSLNERMETQKALVETGTLFQEVLDFSTVLNLIAERLEKLIPFTDLAFLLADWEKRKLFPILAKGRYVKEVIAHSLNIDEGITGSIVQSQKAEIVNDTLKDPRAKHVPGTPEESEAIMVLPLIGRERVLGALAIYRTEGKIFYPEELEIALLFAHQAQVALENAQLFENLKKTREEIEETNKRLNLALDDQIKLNTTLSTLQYLSGMLLSSLKSEEILRLMVEGTSSGLGFEKALLYLLDSKGEYLEWKTAAGIPPEEFERRKGERLLFAKIKDLMQEKYKISKSYFIPSDGLENRSDWQPGDIVFIPLHSKNQLLGLLSLDRPIDGKVPEKRKLLLLETFANTAIISLINAQLYEQAERRIAELSVLHQVGTALTSVLKLNELLDRVIETIMNTFGYLKVVVFLRDKKTDKLIIGGQRGYDEEYLGRLNFPLGEESIVGWVAKTGEALVINDVSQEPRYLMGDPRVRSEIAIPLSKGKSEVIGVLSIEDERLNAFGEDDVRLLSTLANQVTVALENAKLYEEAQRRINELTVLHGVGSSVSAVLRLDELIEQVLTILQETFRYHKIALLLVDEKTNELTIKGAKGYSKREVLTFRIKIGEEGITGWVAAHGEPLLIGDVHQDSRYIEADKKTLSELAVPLRVKEKVIGVINVEDERLNAFDSVDQRLLTTLASQVAIAIDNARLYEEAQRRIDELTVLYGVGKSVTSVLKLDELLQRILEVLAETFHYQKGGIYLSDPITHELVVKAERGYEEELDLGHRVKIWMEGIIGWVAKNGEPILAPDVTKEPRYLSLDESVRSEIAVPLKVKDKTIGVLDVEDERVNAFGEEDLRLLSTLASQVAIAIDNARLYEQTEQLAITDGLTELYNHRYFQEYFDRELSRAKRYQRQLSLIMIDIDHFKDYNDTYGHLMGDFILKELGKILKSNARDVDFVARYGGEEFMILLPETTKNGAYTLAEKIRKRVKEHKFSYENIQSFSQITISLGVANYPDDGEEKEILIDAVDKALYRAKLEGRDRTCV